jgi:5'-nucleotidase
VAELLRRHHKQSLGGWLLNVNVPDVPMRDLKGLRMTRLGRRHKAESVIKTVTPRGETCYWVGAAGPAADAGDGTDFHAIEQGYASVTPLQIDLTHHAELPRVAQWLAQ